MATSTIALDLLAAIFPDGTASNLAPAQVIQKSSGSAPMNYWAKLLFDAGQLEQCMWQFQLPSDYVSTPVLRFKFSMATATSGNVIVAGRVTAVTGGDASDVDAEVFSTVNTSSGIAVAGTAGYVTEATLALTNNDSLAANDLTQIYFARDGASGSDTATGDMELLAVSLEYTS